MADSLYTTMIVFYIAGIAVSFLLNVLVVVVVATKGKRANHLDLLILSLACSDLLQASIGYTVEIIAHIRNVTISDVSCTIAGFSTTFLALVSISHFVGISIQRAVILKCPWKAREWVYKQSMSLYIIIPSWLYGLTWALMPFFGWSSYTRELHSRNRCSISLTNPDTNSRSYAFSLLVFCFIIPVIGISISSMFSVMEMRKMTRAGKDLHMGETTVGYRRVREFKQTIMTFVLIAAFLISWSPYAGCVFVMTSHGTIDNTLMTISALLAKSSTIYNPLIYLLFMKEFRTRCKNLIRCIWMVPPETPKGSFNKVSLCTDITQADSGSARGSFAERGSMRIFFGSTSSTSGSIGEMERFIETRL